MQLTKKLSLAIVVLCIATQAATAIAIKGKFTNATGKYVYIYEYCGLDYFKMDSCAMSADGSFNYKPKKNPVRGVYKVGTGKAQVIELVFGNEVIEVSADLNNVEGTLKIVNSKENDAYREYVTFVKRTNEKNQQLQATANMISQFAQSNPEQYQAEMTKLQSKADSLNASVNDSYKMLSKRHQDYLTGKICALLLSEENDKTKFLDKTLLNDPELGRTTAICIKFINYYQKFYPNNQAEWASITPGLIRDYMKIETYNMESLYAGLCLWFASFDAKTALKLYQDYEFKLPDAKYAKQIKSILPKKEPEVGDMAEEIMLADTTGKPFALSKLRGKVVLIDFWASWCGPCRRENPNVVRIYNKYKDKGFYVFGVSLDQDGKKWKQAIVKDNLTWAHVSDLKGWQSQAAQLYSVRGIPQTFLVDETGKIIAKNLRGGELELKLESLFADKK